MHNSLKIEGIYKKSGGVLQRIYWGSRNARQREYGVFLLGTSIDDYISYWPIEWHKKYYLKEWRGKAYEDESRIALTAWEYEKVTGMLRELKRQPLVDLWGNYEKQVVVEGMYKGKLKLKWTLDRFSQEKQMIRDTKSTSNLKNFTFELSGKYGYEISMAFYYALVKMIRGVDCDVYLDVVQSSGVYQSEVFCYQKERMHTVLIDTIIPALDKLLEMTTQWEETKDESIWKIQPANRYELFDLETYPILETGLQQNISYI